MTNGPEDGTWSPSSASNLLLTAFEFLNEGFGVFDRDLRLINCNSKFGELLGCPPDLCRPGMLIADLFRFHAERGDYGAGDPVALANTRLEEARAFVAQEFERVLTDQRIIRAKYVPLVGQGLLVTCIDITESRRAEMALRESEEALRRKVLELEETQRDLERRRAESAEAAERLATANRAKDAALADLYAVLDNVDYGIAFFDADLRIKM